MSSLVARIQDEKDHSEFLSLLRELNELLERKRRRLTPPQKSRQN